MDTLKNIDGLVARTEESLDRLLRERAQMSAEIGRLREGFLARDEEAVRVLHERTRELEDARIEIERLEREIRRADFTMRGLNDTLTALTKK
ncbi:hypothetical protein AGMMS50276_14350 [Synergistales bacterium]|nr:hypothetical protein AGMMS50276_14350 [Synergistales bacterium]